MMIRRLLYVLFIFILGACSQQEVEEKSSKTNDITLEDVETVIAEQGFELENTELSSEDFFMQELNEMTPEVYILEGHTLSVYVFPSEGEREKGVQRFEEITAAAELVEHKAYEISNLLVFYVSNDEKVQNRLLEALKNLDVST